MVTSLCNKPHLGLVVPVWFLVSTPVLAQVSGAGLWGVKPLSIAQVPKKARFTVLLSTSSALKVDKAQIAWMKKSPWFPQLPARQAVCFTLRFKGQPAVVIQAKSLPGLTQTQEPASGQPASGLNPNVHQAVAEGYFFKGPINGSAWRFGKTGKTDFLVLAMSPTLADQLIQLFKNSS